MGWGRGGIELFLIERAVEGRGEERKINLQRTRTLKEGGGKRNISFIRFDLF